MAEGTLSMIKESPLGNGNPCNCHLYTRMGDYHCPRHGRMLLIPRRAEGPDGLVGDGMIEIDSSDPEYAAWCTWFAKGKD